MEPQTIRHLYTERHHHTTGPPLFKNICSSLNDAGMNACHCAGSFSQLQVFGMAWLNVHKWKLANGKFQKKGCLLFSLTGGFPATYGNASQPPLLGRAFQLLPTRLVAWRPWLPPFSSPQWRSPPPEFVSRGVLSGQFPSVGCSGLGELFPSPSKLRDALVSTLVVELSVHHL
ncbi:hypothetical protein PIB30_042069 [Stylosanthes scabra]|uniref:Uncharacterized protein n=1 Tax=Stylosanthes scabra TaxID=79078 RepID=A0ABU6ZDY0_9FABA|nr:hypothetical protein [Stylosanthes scabra]